MKGLLLFTTLLCAWMVVVHSMPFSTAASNFITPYGSQKNRRDWTGTVLEAQMKQRILGYPCVLLLGPKGTTYGCSQPHNEMSGTLQYIEEGSNFSEVKPSYKKTVFVIEPEDFRIDNVKTLMDIKQTQGLIVLWGSPSSSSSPDMQIPNKGFGTETSFKWNPAGDSLSFASFKKPIWLAHRVFSDFISEFAENNSINEGYPKFGATFYTTMNAGTDSETCLRRGKCLPVGGQSIISSLRPLPNKTKPSVLFASARLDSSSFFHDYVPGADAYTSGLIALLAAHVALFDYLGVENASTLKHPIVFAYFQGESFGYLGSSTFVHDLVNFTCKEVDDEDPTVCSDPYMSSMKYLSADIGRSIGIIDAGQIGLLEKTPDVDDEENLYIHTTEHGQKEQQKRIQEAFEAAAASLASASPHIKVNFVANDTRGLPPSSAMAFVRARNDMPVAVMADHKAEFRNQFYLSHNDDFGLSVQRIQTLSTLLARALLYAANESEVPEDMNTRLVAEWDFVNDLVYCMTVDFKCPLVENLLGKISSGTNLDKTVHISKYVGVFGSSPKRVYVHTYSHLLEDIILNRTHDMIGDSCNESVWCPDDLHCIGVPPNARCMRAPFEHHNAKSLGIEHVDGSWKIVDKTQPLYTESYWETLSLFLTVVDDPTNDTIVLVVGILSFIILIVLVYFIDSFLYKHYKLA